MKISPKSFKFKLPSHSVEAFRIPVKFNKKGQIIELGGKEIPKNFIGRSYDFTKAR